MKRHVMILLSISTGITRSSSLISRVYTGLMVSDHFIENFLSPWEARATFKQNIDGEKKKLFTKFVSTVLHLRLLWPQEMRTEGAPWTS